MIHKDKIKPGVPLVVNSKRNVVSDSFNGLSLHKTFNIGENNLVPAGTKLTCVSKLRSHKSFSGKVVDVEYNGEVYSTYWMEIRLQCDYHPTYLRKEKLEQIESKI